MDINIAILDDHPVATSGLVSMLQLYSQIKIQAVYNTSQRLIDNLSKKQPDVILLDIQLPDIPGNEVAEIINSRYPEIRIIAFTSVDNIYQVKDMIRRGCKGYLLKSAEPNIVLDAIQEVFAGNQYFDTPIRNLLLQDSLKIQKQKASKVPLTRRENEILQLIVAEYTNQQIADQLFLSLRTVEHHRYSILHKLGAKNTAGAIKQALQLGLVK